MYEELLLRERKGESMPRFSKINCKVSEEMMRSFLKSFLIAINVIDEYMVTINQ